jgi:hypothetical protein
VTQRWEDGGGPASWGTVLLTLAGWLLLLAMSVALGIAIRGWTR